jgi:hypothetical protein
MDGEQEYPFWNYRDLALFAGMALPSILLSLAMVAAMGRVYSVGKAAPVLMVQFLGYLFWFISLYALLRMKYGRPFWLSLKWEGRAAGVGRALLAGPAVALTVGWMGMLLGNPDRDLPMLELLSDRWSIVLVGLFAVTLGPLCEELAFRGFLMPLLTKTLGPVVGIVIAAAPFALMHGPQYGWSWRHIVLVGLAGVAFGWTRFATGSTAAAAAMHSTYNLTFFMGFLISRGDFFQRW